jgi:hypothetical protein
MNNQTCLNYSQLDVPENMLLDLPDCNTRKGRRLQYRHVLRTAAIFMHELMGRADEAGERRLYADGAALFQALDYFYGKLPEESKSPAEMTLGEYRESLLYVLLGAADLSVDELAQEMRLGKKKLKVEPRNLRRALHTMCHPTGRVHPKSSATKWRDPAVHVIRKHLLEAGRNPQDFTNLITAVFESGPPTHLPNL